MAQNQTKRVTIDGKSYVVPFDATIEEVEELIGGSTTPTPPQSGEKSFWDSTFGRFLGPSVDTISNIPSDIKNTVSILARGVKSDPIGFMKGTALAMTNPIAFAQTPVGQAIGQSIVGALTEDVQQGGEKLRQGDWAGGMGEALDATTKIVGGAAGGPLMRAVAKGTGMNRLPNAIYRAGLRVQGPTARSFGDASTLAARGLDEGITSFDAAQAALSKTENQLNSLVGGMKGHTLPAVTVVNPAFAATYKQGKIGSRLGRIPELTKELDTLQMNTMRDAPDTWFGPKDFTAQELLEGKRGSAMEANYSRNTLGDLTTSDIHELWYNNLGKQQKSGLDTLAKAHGRDVMPSELLAKEQEIMGIMDAIGRRTGQGSHFGQASLAAGMGNAIGSQTPVQGILKGGVTAGIANALTNPNIMLPTALGLQRAGRAVSATPTVGGSALINAILRQYQQQQQPQGR